jgi:hypothetical protein
MLGRRYQLKACLPGEFGVSAEHFNCEGDFVDNALSWAVSVVEQFQIFWSVIFSVTIFVVHGFVRTKRSAEHLLHNIAVFKHFVHRNAISRWDSQYDVAAFDATRYVGRSVFFSVKLTDPLVFTLLRAKFLLNIYAATLVAMAHSFFTAIHASEFVARFSFFSASCVHAIHRAIYRIAVEFLSVSSQVRLHHDKRFTAFFAGEGDRCSAQGRQSLLVEMRSSTRQTAILAAGFSFARVAVERLAAVHARHLDRHGFAPLCGNKGSLAMSFGGCQVE